MSKEPNEAEEKVERLEAERIEIGREHGLREGELKIRRKRKRVKESRDANFRKEGKTEQELVDPSWGLEQLEEESWVRSKKGHSKRRERRLAVLWMSAMLLLALGLGGLFVARQRMKDPEERKAQAATIQIALPEEVTPQDAIEEPVKLELNELESISMQLPALRDRLREILEVLESSKSLDELKSVLRPYPELESDLRQWLAQEGRSHRPRASSFTAFPTLSADLACVQVMGELGDFSYYVSYLVKSRDQDAQWLLDWESFIGKSEIAIPELSRSGSSGPVTVRGMVSPGQFFTPPIFSDKDWACYLVRTLEPSEYIWAYTPKGGVLDKRLDQMIAGRAVDIGSQGNAAPRATQGMKAFRLRLLPARGSVLKSQYEIQEILGHGWLRPYDSDEE